MLRRRSTVELDVPNSNLTNDTGKAIENEFFSTPKGRVTKPCRAGGCPLNTPSQPQAGFGLTFKDSRYSNPGQIGTNVV